MLNSKRNYSDVVIKYERSLWKHCEIFPLAYCNINYWTDRCRFYYFCLFAFPITGWIFITAAGHFPHIGNLQFIAPGIQKDKELAKLLVNSHVTLARTVLSLLTLHFSGALKHHYINKDNIKAYAINLSRLPSC